MITSNRSELLFIEDRAHHETSQATSPQTQRPTPHEAQQQQQPEHEAHQETLEITLHASSRAWALEVQDEEGARRIPVGREPVIFGSGSDATFVLADRTVSARHCEVSVAKRGIAVRDLGSKNGTFVGGARVPEALGAEGTVITIGRTTLVCVGLDDRAEEDELAHVPALPGLAGSSLAMRKVAAQVRKLAASSSPVLVTGETGVGKELVARALHTEGARASGPFLAINVAALPRELVESELFGHERGAFTGAVSKKVGAFREADGGTLFLDEIGELPLDAQPKLLRALDGYEVRRVGAAGSGKKTSARVVVATHVPLAERVTMGAFRRDLFHRLEVFVIELPPLRERPGDIVPIARQMLRLLETEIGARDLTPAAIGRLAGHSWPGNVRELRNALLRAAHVTEGTRWLDAAAIDKALRRSSSASLDLSANGARELLEAHRGNVSAAARASGLPRTTYRRILSGELPGPKKAR